MSSLRQYLERQEIIKKEENLTDRQLLDEPLQRDNIFETVTIQKEKAWTYVGQKETINNPYKTIEKGKYFSHVLNV